MHQINISTPKKLINLEKVDNDFMYGLIEALRIVIIESKKKSQNFTFTIDGILTSLESYTENKSLIFQNIDYNYLDKYQIFEKGFYIWILDYKDFEKVNLIKIENETMNGFIFGFTGTLDSNCL